MPNIQTIAETGNGRENNKVFTINDGESVTCRFKASSTDSATNKYYGIGDTVFRCAILNNNIASLTHTNGHELDFPLTLGIVNWNTWTKGIRWKKITVRADTNDTRFEVYAF